ncbi:MAG: hypothetical protein JWO78_55 [Micavibrio sp.]|nr:hypothetical protein [Micavibrio sp.]
MAFKSAFLRENFVTVLGIALPLLLVAVFALARVATESSTPAPQYKAVYAWAENARGGKFLFSVGPDKALTITFRGTHYNGKDIPNDSSAAVTVFVMDVNNGAVTRHTYTVPNAFVEGISPVDMNGQKITLAAQGTLAPDGYVFTNNRTDYYSGGLLPDLFGGNRRYGDNTNIIVKSGRTYPLDTSNGQGATVWSPVDFIGWTKD